MSWQIGLMLIIFVACILPWLWCLIADAMGSRDDWETWDEAAEQKRRTEKQAKNLSREFK